MWVFEIVIKKMVATIIKHPWFVKNFLISALKLHNLSYQIAGMLSAELEPDGLHPKHRLIRYHDWFAERLITEWNVLDIGCGNGALAYDMKAACRSVTAIDIDQANIQKARKMFSREGITYICADALDYPFKQKFEAIVLSNVLEHIDKRVDFLKMVFANQDANNPPVLLLRVPMITRDWISMYKKEVNVEWRLDYTHCTEYTLEQVFSELKQAGLIVESYDVQFGEFYGVFKKEEENAEA